MQNTNLVCKFKPTFGVTAAEPNNFSTALEETAASTTSIAVFGVFSFGTSATGKQTHLTYELLLPQHHLSVQCG